MDKRIAIIGAGMSGLAATRCALLYGMTPVVFESAPAAGGLWLYKENVTDGPSVMRNTVTNTSKEMTAFSDFVPLKESPVFMNQREVYKYLMSYSDHNGLQDHITFNTTVLAVRRSNDYAETGTWIVEYKNKDAQRAESDVFDGVLFCTGHHSKPWRPLPWRNEKAFKGSILHSIDYRNAENFRNKTVVIVGFGNSAVDCAVDLSNVAKQVYLSTRRGAWLKPRTGRRGMPRDIARTRANYYKSKMIPDFIQTYSEEQMLQQRLDHVSYGIAPEHHVFSAHPTISDELPSKIASGLVIVKPNVEGFEPTSVEFDDGSIVQDVDAVILCTGFSFDFKILEGGNLVTVFPENDAHLYKLMYPTKLSDHNTLAMIGYVQPMGSTFPVAEMQSRLFFSVLSGETKLPESADMIAELEWHRCQLSLNYVKSRRHTMEVDFIAYMDDLAKLINARPNICKLLTTDIRLALHILFGPCTAYQYRLEGPNKWEGARDAILNSGKRIFYPNSQDSSFGILSQTFECLKNILLILTVIVFYFYVF